MNNPLARYKLQDPMLTWEMLETSTGIKVQTLISISQKNEESIGNVNLSNVEKLKRKLGIDLGTYYKCDEESR